ncbi:polymer-forming cytoskeletal protein [Desulfosporosinus burensis]
MFKRPSSNQSSGGDTTFIAAECQITGSMTIKGNARIDGKVDGNVQVTGDLIIGANAFLKANIEANTVSLAGEVCGNIKTTDLLELNASARLVGDICTRQFKVEQGAHFTGSSQLLEEAKTPLTLTEDSKELHAVKDKKLISKRS